MLSVQAGQPPQCRFRALRGNTFAGYFPFALDILYSQALAGPFCYDIVYQPIKQHKYHGKCQSCNLLTASSPGILPYARTFLVKQKEHVV